MEKPAGAPSDSRDLRRSQRFEVLVLIHVSWSTPTGQTISDRAEVVEANQHGGLLAMRIYPPLGENLELHNLISGEKAAARAIAFRHGPAHLSGVAVELIQPSGDFWGITYRLRRASMELKNLKRLIWKISHLVPQEFFQFSGIQLLSFSNGNGILAHLLRHVVLLFIGKLNYVSLIFWFRPSLRRSGITALSCLAKLK